jgi:hypothetical protein
MNDNEYPALYGGADASSTQYQRNFYGALIGSLGCLTVSALLSVINLPAGWFAAVQIVVLLTSLGLTIYLATKQPQGLWYEARALSESVKTVSWRYMMRAEPFDGSDSEARRHFLETLGNILQANKRSSSRAIKMLNTEQITTKMIGVRSLDLPGRKDCYHAERVSDQHDWYTRKAKSNARASDLWFGLVIAANALAVLIAVGKILFPTVDHWPTDVFVAIAASLMAWLQTKRYQELAASYALTTHEIGLLRAAFPDDGDERSFSEFVADSESAFSREHTQWQARRHVD